VAEPAVAPEVVATAEPVIVPEEEAVQEGTSAAAFFANAKADLAANNPCGDDLKALVQDTKIYFPSGGLIAEASGLVKARVIGKIAEDCPNYTLKIRGHSDPSGDSAVNLALSKKRAETLMKLLASSGVNTKDFITVGMGDKEPSNVVGPLGSAYYDRRVDFQVVESVKTASAAGFVQQPWNAVPAASSACAAELKVRAEQTRLFYNTRSITVSPTELAPVYELVEVVGACEGAHLRVMGHHSDLNGANENLKTGCLRALVLMGSLVAAGYEGEKILVGAPSHSVGVANQPTLPRSRVDFQIIMD